ncbi:class I SAM-dependent methyltransferase [Thermocoleostomius sinensis]|uniref:Class I SAM-dependent methyltransferase n=1 Tax=Thermocoleostomius sinensis A174 TaxID=2016057 RepID=A0A9E8Z9R1_9CYAN|nr:class I SAM-dependent methyltransferase [Thermocoleostomius sinensis]WAL59155.1 class I SAM-dependent methyltransferase [Thermocoleostomius sinensis A174]
MTTQKITATTALFWNQIYTNHTTRMPNASDPMLLAAIEFFGDIRNRKLLDLGCGDGRSSLFFAQRGAQVTAIDISEVAIHNLTQFCHDQAITNINPVHCSAFDIAELGSFDFIFGNMILHHLEPFDAFVRVLHQGLATDGKAYFRENSAFSSLLVWFRNHVVGKFGIPKGGDDDEAPLSPQEVAQLQQAFQVEIDYPELLFFRLASQYLLRGRLHSLMKQLDDYFFQFPTFRKYSYRQNLFLSSK